MSAPINEFVKQYIKSGCVRFHMPGHKGIKLHGLEEYDITEIKGADYLFETHGIIAQSEAQAARLFGSAKTLYSTEGSSLCIKTMLGIVNHCRRKNGMRMSVIAPRNVHKAFINACILLDIDVCWVYPKKKSRSICSGTVTADDIASAIDSFGESGGKPDCVYVTSPDYLGFISDIRGISAVCRSKDIPLLCDNAHGAYLNFLENNIHPMTLGADMCCDSAHKTLPCYTGSAMLHISPDAPEGFARCAKNVMSLFASTSPSYLILESLDLFAGRLAGEYGAALRETILCVKQCKKRLTALGWSLEGDEPCKITVCAAKSGLSGDELGERLRGFNIEAEYTDDIYAVFMISPFNGEGDLTALERAMGEIARRAEGELTFDEIPRARAIMPIREAAFSRNCEVDINEAEGKICAMTVTSCQPSVPVVVSGEEITAEVIALLKRYGQTKVAVILEESY